MVDSQSLPRADSAECSTTFFIEYMKLLPVYSFAFPRHHELAERRIFLPSLSQTLLFTEQGDDLVGFTLIIFLVPY